MYQPSRFDFFDREQMRDPYPYFAEMRDTAPLYYDAKMKAYVVSRHEDVTHVLKHPALFSSVDVRVAGRLQQERASAEDLSTLALIGADPPIHTRMRGLVSRSFTPKQISAMEPRVRELSQGFITEMLSRDEFDFMNGLASPLPVTVIAEMLGVDTARRHDFKRWSDSLMRSSDATLRTGQIPAEVQQNSREMLDYMTQVAGERRREPRGDLISLLVQESEGVAALTAREVNSFTVLLLIAGNETTTNLLGNALQALVRHPDAYEPLRRDPSQAACAAVVEETLRYDSPVIAVVRRSTQEVELSGGKVPANASVLALVSSANRDPRKFPDPERFDPRRDTSGLMSFGHGIHFCLGAPLTRLEAPVALQELMQRAPRLGLSPRQPPKLDYGGSFFLRGPRSLWLQKQ